VGKWGRHNTKNPPTKMVPEKKPKVPVGEKNLNRPTGASWGVGHLVKGPVLAKKKGRHVGGGVTERERPTPSRKKGKLVVGENMGGGKVAKGGLQQNKRTRSQKKQGKTI